MKYVSLDLETSGLNPNACQILMLSMVVEDTTKPEIPVEELPHYTIFLDAARSGDYVIGEPYALAMNGWIFDYISGRKKDAPYPIKEFWQRDESGYWVDEAIAFLAEHFPNEKKVTVAGKNVASFDLKFLPQELQECFRHRVLDIGPMFVDFTTDTMIPDLLTVKKRAGIDSPVAHDAREDAMDVIRVLRTRYGK